MPDDPIPVTVYLEPEQVEVLDRVVARMQRTERFAAWTREFLVRDAVTTYLSELEGSL